MLLELDKQHKFSLVLFIWQQVVWLRYAIMEINIKTTSMKSIPFSFKVYTTP